MANTYFRYPTGGVPKYATFSALPASASSGDVAITIDTDVLYAFNGTTWIPIGGPGAVIGIAPLDSQPANANALAIAAGLLSTQSATGSFPGVVNTGAQSFSGIKNFNSNIFAANLSGTNSGDVTIGTANGLSLSGQALSLGLSSTSTTGALSSTDWNTFNGKQPAGSYLTAVSVATANGVSGTSSGGTTPALTITLGDITPSSVAATGTVTGSNLSGTNTGDVTLGTANGLSLTGQALSLGLSSTSTTGALSSTDWNMFNGKQPAGTYVTAVSVATANGVSGTSSGGTTPALTLSLGAITPTMVNGNTLTTGTGTLTLSTFTLTVSGTANVTGTNSGDITASAVGSTPNANGFSLTGQQVTLQPANGTQPGVLTAIAQTIGGAKTFSSSISASNLTGSNTGDVTFGTVGATPVSQAATVAGQMVTLQPADGTNPGLLTAIAQTIGGAKTFNTGVLYPVTASKVANYNVANTDYLVQGSASGGAFTFTLPTAVGITGQRFVLERTDQTLGNIITIATTSAQTINGITTKHLATQYERYVLISDGANWHVESHTYPSTMTAYSPTLASSGGGSITLNGTGKVDPTGYWWRIGSRMYVLVTFKNGTGGAATGTAGNVQIPLPATPDTTQMIQGTGFGMSQGFGVFYGGVTYQAANSVSATGSAFTLIGGAGVATGSFVQVSDLAASSSMYVRGEFPVASWDE